MTIKSVNSGQNIYKSNEQDEINNKYKSGAEAAGKNAPAGKSDKLEISPEALKLADVKKKISSRFYEKPEVVKQTAKKILKDLA